MTGTGTAGTKETPPAVPVSRARAHVLAKQGLAGNGLGTVMDAIVATAGIYGTAPTCYLSAAARVRDFRLAALDQELYAKRSVVRLRCMRGMAYIEPLDLLPALFACTGEAPDATLKRVAKYSGIAEPELLKLAERVLEAMAGRPPMTLREIREALSGELPGASQALQMTVAMLGRTGRVVRAEVRGSWRSDNYTYARWSDWLDGPVEPLDPAAARVQVARRYLRAYGPATADDLKWWSGWTKRDTVAALAALGEEVSAVALEGAPAWVLAGELDALRDADPEAGRGVRLLPVWDAYFMGYAASPAGRARQVAAGDYGRVYDKSGNGTSTVIVDGMAAGVWQLDADAGTATIAPFGNTLADRWTEAEAQVTRLSAAIGADLRTERAPEPGALAGGPRNTFLSPISLGRPAGSP
jgi:Winged helix DNA-binding domain